MGIVERLRRAWPRPKEGALGDLHEAADEIERLRRELSEALADNEILRAKALDWLNAYKAECAEKPWQAHDLEVGRSYESKNFGAVVYLGIDDFYGEKTHAFEVGRMQRRYWKTEKLGEFLKPKVPAAIRRGDQP